MSIALCHVAPGDGHAGTDALAVPALRGQTIDDARPLASGRAPGPLAACGAR